MLHTSAHHRLYLLAAARPLVTNEVCSLPHALAAMLPLPPVDLQRQRLLEGRAALDPSWSNQCLFDWTNTSYPCVGNVAKWTAAYCRDGMVTELDFSNCRPLGGTLPATWGLGGLEALTTLYVDNMQLKGTLPAAWAGLTSLHTLGAENNRLTGSMG
jgi:hypothetical protein